MSEREEYEPQDMAGEAYPLLRDAVSSILNGSPSAKEAHDALLARGLTEEESREEIARVLLATMFHVGAQSEMLDNAGGGAGLRRLAFKRLATGETAREILEAAGEDG